MQVKENYYQKRMTKKIGSFTNMKDKIHEGDVFDRLTAIKFDHKETKKYKSSKVKGGFTNKNFYYWEFKCTCGNTKVCDIKPIMYKEVKSCGCLQREQASARLPINALPDGEAAFNSLLRNYIRSGKERGHEFLLSKDEFKYLTKQDCYYCGVKPYNISKHGDYKTEYIFNGVDRVNSKDNYTLENCVTCCKRCNYAKHTMTEQEWLEWTTRFVNYNKHLINEKESI